MAEGDTIHRARLRLEPVLAGQVLDHFWARKLRGLRPRVGQQVVAVRADGKHLLVDFDRELTLDTHLGMGGSWRAYPGDTRSPVLDRARRNPRLRVELATPAGTALCFGAPTIQTFVRSQSRTPVSHLGPDLTAPDPDIASALRNARALHLPTDLLAEVLLDQRVAGGIGNIFKSEALHHQRLFPFAPLGQIDDARLMSVFATAADLLGRNAHSADQVRSTTPHGGFFVYRRFRKPCLRCATPIERSYLGPSGRSTYWCPRCQPEPAGAERLSPQGPSRAR